MRHSISDDADNNKKRKRRQQKRDYATRKRQQDKKLLETLEKNNRQLSRRSRRQKRQIEQLKAWAMYAKSYLSLCYELAVIQVTQSPLPVDLTLPPGLPGQQQSSLVGTGPPSEAAVPQESAGEFGQVHKYFPTDCTGSLRQASPIQPLRRCQADASDETQELDSFGGVGPPATLTLLPRDVCEYLSPAIPAGSPDCSDYWSPQTIEALMTSSLWPLLTCPDQQLPAGSVSTEATGIRVEDNACADYSLEGSNSGSMLQLLFSDDATLTTETTRSSLTSHRSSEVAETIATVIDISMSSQQSVSPVGP